MKYQEPKTPLLNLFDFDRFPPSITNLPAAMIINNITVYPTFRYNGKDAGATVWNPWGYGQQLALQSGTQPTYNNGSPLLGSLDDSVLFNGDGYYADTSGTTFGNVSTNDVVGEIIFKTIASKVLFAKRAAAIGYVIGINATPALYITIQDASGSVTVTSAALTSTAIYHASFYLDRSGSGQIYINGAVSGSAVAISTRALTISAAIALTIGADGADANQYTSNIHYLSLWQSAAWLDTHLQPIIAKTRFMQLTGMYPQQARGTYLPTTYTRNLASYIDKIESDGTTKLYYVGANWPRVCSRIDSAGKTIKGYLEEVSTINRCPYSNDYSNHGASGWSASRCSITTTNVLCPDGITRTTNTLHEDTTADETHQLAASTAASINLFGVYAKAVNRSWMCLSMHDGASSAYFNLTTGVVGTITGGTTSSGIKSYGNGWYLCWMLASHAAFEGIYIRAAEADNDNRFNGLDQDSLYLFEAQCVANNYPTSPINTPTGSPVTKPADVLTFVANDGNVTAGQGTLVYDILLPSYDVTTDGYAVSISNAGSATANIKSGLRTSGDVSVLLINNTTAQANVKGTTDIAANTIKTITNTWNTNSATVAVNSAAEGTPSTTCTIPTITQIDFSDEIGGNQINGLISNVKIYGSDNSTKNR